MPRDIVYFDLETQRTANDAGGWARKGDMRMSVGVIFSTATGRYEVFGEAQVNQLVERLRRADLVVGFNVLNFDYQVLMGYTILDLVAELPTADLMADMEKRLGHRLGLDAIAHATLGIQKTGAGLDAIKWWREGHPGDRGVLLLRREGHAARTRARLPAQGTILSRSLRAAAAGRDRLGASR